MPERGEMTGGLRPGELSQDEEELDTREPEAEIDLIGYDDRRVPPEELEKLGELAREYQAARDAVKEATQRMKDAGAKMNALEDKFREDQKES